MQLLLIKSEFHAHDYIFASVYNGDIVTKSITVKFLLPSITDNFFLLEFKSAKRILLDAVYKFTAKELLINIFKTCPYSVPISIPYLRLGPPTTFINVI